MFRFADPYYFLLLIPTIAAIWFVYRRSVRSGLLFSASFRLAVLKGTWRTTLSRVMPMFILIGLILSVFALARPQNVFSLIHRDTNAIAIEMVVDVSGSMEALDLSIKTGTGTRYRTRLEAVKEVFADFVKQRPDDLIGLVTFGGYASTRAPLTSDHDALLHVLKGVDIPKTVLNREGRIVNQEELNTAIGDGLATACARIKNAEPESRIIVLLSDGESNTGIIEPKQAMRAASELGIKVYTIGVGSSGLAPVKGKDMFGRDVIQRIQVSLDEELLTQIAITTGGQYFNVRNPKGLKKALEQIDKLEKTEVERDVYEQYDELFPWFLFPSLCLIALGAALNVTLARRII